jgi:hypothetical protein
MSESMTESTTNKFFTDAFGADFVSDESTLAARPFSDAIRGLDQSGATLAADVFAMLVQSETQQMDSQEQFVADTSFAVADSRSWEDPASGVAIRVSVTLDNDGVGLRRLELTGLERETIINYECSDSAALRHRSKDRLRWIIWSAESDFRVGLLLDGVLGFDVHVTIEELCVRRPAPRSAKWLSNLLEAPDLIGDLLDDSLAQQLDTELVDELHKMAASPSAIERLAAQVVASRLGHDGSSPGSRAWWDALGDDLRSSWLHAAVDLVDRIEDVWSSMLDTPDHEDDSGVDRTALQNVRLRRISLQRAWLFHASWLFSDSELAQALYQLDQEIDISLFELPCDVLKTSDSDMLFQTFVLSALAGETDPWWFLVHRASGHELTESEDNA